MFFCSKFHFWTFHLKLSMDASKYKDYYSVSNAYELGIDN